MQITKEIGRTPEAFENVVVTGGAVVRLNQAFRERARAIDCTVEDQAIRYKIEGGDPTITEGHLVAVAADFSLNEPHAIDDLRMIANGAQLTAAVMVTYLF